MRAANSRTVFVIGLVGDRAGVHDDKICLAQVVRQRMLVVFEVGLDAIAFELVQPAAEMD